MKILQVIPYFDWSYGGPVKVVYDISNELSKLGNEVEVYTTDVGKNGRIKNENFIKSKSFKISYFPCDNNFLAHRFKLHFSKDMLLEIKNNIKKFDVVHIHEWRGIPHKYIYEYAKKNDVPYVLQAHGSSPRQIYDQNMLFILSKYGYDKLIGKKIISNAKKLIALNNNEKMQFLNQGVPEKKIEIVPNGVNLENKCFKQKGLFKQKYGIPIDSKLILYLGRITPIKGLELLIKSFFLLNNEKNDSILVITGPDYNYLNKLKKLVHSLKLSEKIIFTGPLFGIDKLEVFSDTDLFILPSIYETFPISVIEACAHGIPVIVTHNCLIADIIHENVGYAVESNEESIKEAIINILYNKDIKDSFSESGKKLIKEEYNWNKIVKKLIGIYKDSMITF